MTGTPFAFKTATRKPDASSKSDCQGSPKAEKTEWSHNLRVSPATVHHTEAVFSTVSGIYGREHDDPMNDLDVNMAIWGIFMNATLRAAVHLGQDHEPNLRYVRNTFGTVWAAIRETGKLISDQKKITGISPIDFQYATWMSTSLLCEKAYWITNAKVYVFSDSLLCVGKMGDDPIATWKSKIQCYSENFKEMNRIDAMPTEFQWKIFPGIMTWGLLEKIQSLMRHFYSVHLGTSLTRSSSCQCNGEQKETRKDVNTIQRQLQIFCSQISSRSLVFLGAWITREVVRNLH